MPLRNSIIQLESHERSNDLYLLIDNGFSPEFPVVLKHGCVFAQVIYGRVAINEAFELKGTGLSRVSGRDRDYVAWKQWLFFKLVSIILK